MHHLQTQILYNLALHDGLKFSQLKPSDLESNQFMYHLKAVMAQGYVQKDDALYKLTAKGIRYVNSLSFELMSTRLQPVLKTMIFAENDKGEQLLYRFNRQPLRGRVGFVTGKVHYGETLEQAAARELREKSGLSADLSFAGQINSRNYDGIELLTHTFYFVFRAIKPTGTLTKSDLHGESFWGTLSSYRDNELMPGLSQIYQYLIGPQSATPIEIETNV